MDLLRHGQPGQSVVDVQFGGATKQKFFIILTKSINFLGQLLLFIFIRFEPLQASAFPPFADEPLAILTVVDSDAFLFAVYPVADEPLIFGREVHSRALPFVHFILSLVPPAIGPVDLALSVHFIVFPVALVGLAVLPVELAVAV